MKPFILSFLILASIFSSSDLKANTASQGKVYVAEIRGSINPGVAAYFEHVLRLSEQDANSRAVLIYLDTPGGLLSSTRRLIQAVARSRLPILVYVGPSGASATSAGAILLVSAHVAGMAPGTNLGAAHPVGSQGENIAGDLREKAVNDTVAMIKSMAQERKRPEDVIEKMVRSSTSYTSKEASDLKIIDSFSDSIEGFLKSIHGRTVLVEGRGERIQLDLESVDLVSIEMSYGQKLLHFLADPNVATVLMSLGMLLIYVEVSTPGVTIAGILGGVCLIAGFMAFQLLPIRAGGLLLLVLGLLMVIVEAFTPTHGALALGGLISLILGVLWVMDPSGGAFQISPWVWVPTVFVSGTIIFLISWGALRSKRLTERVLKELKGSGVGGLQGYSGIVDFVDSLDPKKGTAVFRGEIWKVYALDRPLIIGDHVKAESIEGLVVHVRLVSSFNDQGEK